MLQVVRRPGRDRPDVSAFLALFEHKIRDQSRLSLPEVQAIAAYLSTSVPEFSVFSHADAVLKVRARSLLAFVLQGWGCSSDRLAHILSNIMPLANKLPVAQDFGSRHGCLPQRCGKRVYLETVTEQSSLLLRARRAWCGRHGGDRVRLG